MNTNTFSHRCGVLLALLGLLWICTVTAQTHEDTECIHEPLPTSLNTISYLNFNKEFHAQGEFLINQTLFEEEISFTLDVESVVRFYIAPHEIDVDIWLYNRTGTREVAISHSSLDIGTEEVVRATLTPGKYAISLPYFGFWLGTYNPRECETITMEMAIVPKATLAQRTSSYPCPGSENFPNIDFTPLQSGAAFSYDSDVNQTGIVFNVRGAASTDRSDIRFVNGYSFTVPATNDAALWKFHATLGYDFITGGSLGLMLQYGGNLPNISCVAEGNCTLGAALRTNELSLLQVLSPGSYTLWLYDQIGEKDDTLMVCVPFSLKLFVSPEMMQEDFLNCRAPQMPHALMPGQFDSPPGFLHYRADVLLDLEVRSHVITFTITTPSFFRILVAPHRVDIDLILVNANTRQIVDQTLSWGGAESLVEFLDAANYNLTLQYYGKYDIIFCETFNLEIAIAPASVYPSFDYFCPGTSSSTAPDLSGLNAALAGANHNFSMNAGPFYYFLNRNYAKRTFFTQNFTIVQASSFKASLNKHFLLGDLNLWVVDSRGNKIEAEHRRNHERLFTMLEPGEYTLAIGTGPSQSASLPRFPNCTQYGLELEIKPQVVGDDCWRHARVPLELNTVRFLGSSDIVHIQENFLVPLRPGSSQWVASERVHFRPHNNSFFRVWTEPHHIDVDFHLYESGTSRAVASAISVNNEEEIVYKLLAGKDYNLEITYYHWNHPSSVSTDPACFVFNLELAISPIYAGPDVCTTSLPPQNLIPPYHAGSADFYTEETYAYQQTATAHLVSLPFTVADDFILFRAKVFYDFVWSDLSVRVLPANGSQEALYFADNGYNFADLGSVLLAPGSYILQIYEPTATTMADLRRCTSYTLFVGYQPATGSSSQKDLVLGCDSSPLPHTLNTIAFLSALSNYRTHWQRKVLVDVFNAKDYIEFSLASPSLFTVLVPHHPNVDVDLQLWNGTKASHTRMIANKNGYSEESLQFKLEAGNYYFETRYYGMRGASLPPSSECTHYPMELAVTPVSVLEAMPSVTTACTTSATPGTLTPNSLVRGSYTRSMNTGYSRSIPFTLSQPGTLDFQTRFHFQTGGLTMVLDGNATESGHTTPVHTSYFSGVGYNHAWIRKTLPAGSYALTIHDPFDQVGRDRNLVCSAFEIKYYLNTTAPDDFCDETERLPTDLYSAEGGSADYGGPQDPTDGSVRIFSENFFLDDTQGRDHFITFKVPVPSFVRAFSKSSPRDDIDFFLYSNVNRTTGSLKYVSIGMEEVESAIVKLDAQTNDYLLDLYFFRVNHQIPCPAFHFEFAMKPVETVRQELLCPNPLPTVEVPQPVYTIRDDVWISDEYLFTRNRINANTVNGIFTYRITLNVLSNTTLYSSIGYDFLANDFQLVISDAASSNVLTKGVATGVENRDSYYNFESVLYAELAPGQYYLDIKEDLNDKDFGFTAYCHKFEFFLAAFTRGVPEVEYVVPNGGSNLNPFLDLVINVYFSAPVAFTTPLLTWIINNNAVYLYPEDATSNHIFPTTAAFDTAKEVLTLAFSSNNFQVGKTYDLFLDATKFTKSDGTAFTDSTGPHVYRMNACSCGGHGRCVTANRTLTCQCDEGYTGPNCESCARGYHGVGTTCVANLPCTPGICNGHGTCNDTRGYPQCFCDLGWATAGDDFCTVCAAGYSGANCTKDGEEEHRSTRCNAPLLPTSLDTVPYLGFNGDIHLSDNYYVDIDNSVHEIRFSLSQESVFRAYSEPHWLDIDLWLYSLKDDGTVDKYIDSGIAIGTEEIIFRTLPGRPGAHPAKYLLRLRYFQWTRTKNADCETFNFELAISPVSKVQAEANRINTQCGTGNVVPAPPGVTGTNIMQISSDYTYAPSSLFSVRSQTNPPDGPNYFYHFNFHIAAQPGKAAKLVAEVGYRFLPGDLAVLLEVGRNQTHCGPRGGYDDNCFAGSNTFNRNMLSEILLPGNYSLWVYEPEPQNASLTRCSLFTFKFDVKYIDIETDKMYCSAATFPKSLNSPGYFDARGHVHVVNNFLVEDASMAFTITQRSVARVHVYSLATSSLTFTDANTKAVIKASARSTRPEIFATLQPGTYTLDFAAFVLPSGSCPVARMELVIAPDVPIYSTCPGREVLPTLTNLRVPFSFGTTTEASPVPASFYAYTNQQTVRSWTFTPDQSAVFEAMLSSDFLTAGFELVLQWNENSGARSVYGIHNYNQNFLRQDIETGVTYTFKIIRPDSTTTGGSPPVSFPLCAEFNFEVNIRPQTVVDASPCLVAGQPLPTTFNTVRFLGLDDHFDYQSSWFRVPDFGTSGFVTQKVVFNVTKDSLFRVYTEPHVIDIDLALYVEGIESSVANGGYGFNNEESLVYKLEANKKYTLQLIYWKWTDQIPQCPLFNMEVSVVPFDANHRPLAQMCPRFGSDHWPPALPATLPSPFIYSSVQLGEELYYQQRFQELRSSTPLAFTLTEKSNLHAELGYDFVTGDLMLKLQNTQSKAVYYGSNTLNGNVLTQLGLEPGTYTLTIYEVIKNLPEYQGCSPFTFELMILKDDSEQLADSYPRLPADLSSLPFLFYAGRVHLQGFFELFGPSSSQEQVTFTLTATSLLRVATAHSVNNLEEVQLVLHNSSDHTIAASMSDILEVLTPGRYTLFINKPLSNGNQDIGALVLDMEIQIETITQLSADISNLPAVTCTNSAFPSKIAPTTGFWQYHDDNMLMTSQTLATKTNLYTIPITLAVDSVVYVQLGFHFLLSDMEMTLTGTSSFDHRAITLNGRNGRNLHELNEVVPAGSYTLKIAQPMTFDFLSQLQVSNFCARFTSTIVIVDKSLETDHVDCSTYDLIPSDLNDPKGTSTQFGGPIDSAGVLHLYSDSFLMPPTSNTVNTMFMNITKESLVSVVSTFVSGAGVSYVVQKGTSMKLMYPPLVSSSTRTQRSEVFKLDTPGNGKAQRYEIELHYQPPSRTACPRYALQVHMQPVEQVRKALICTGTGALPANQVITTADNPQYSEFVSSYIPTDVFNRYVANNKFTYLIDLRVNKTSSVVLNLGYNALVSQFEVSLFRTVLGTRARVGTAAYSLQRTAHGDTNINQIMYSTLTAAAYQIEITAPVLSTPIIASDTNLCAPYTWSLQVVPDDGSPTITSVEPSVGDRLSPLDDLNLELTFSGAVNVNPQTLLSALYLYNDVTHAEIAPTAVERDIGSAQYWRVRFAASSSHFTPKHTYVLKLKPNVLQDSTGKPVRLITNNIYSMMDTSCNNKGSFDRGYCFCRGGYAGFECNVCDNGYRDTNQTGTINCQRITGKLCLENSCGCDPIMSTVDNCIPLGTCDDSTGVIRCTCKERNYDAAQNCQACANGFENFSKGCPKKGTCDCVRGTCNPRTNKCECPPHWAGSRCTDCASGWSGFNCSESTGEPSNNGGGSKAASAFRVIGILVAVFAIIATVAFFIYRRYIRPKPYGSLALEDTDDYEAAAELTDKGNNDYDDDNASSKPRFVGLDE